MRMRLYHLDGSYWGNGGNNARTEHTDCYVRLMFYDNPSEAQRNNSVINVSGTKATQTIPTASTGNRKYTANFTSATRYYTITFNGNGGTSTSKSVTYNGTINPLPTFTRTQSGTHTYSLKGWYTATSGGTQITTSTKFTSAQTVYAQWNATARTCTVTKSGTNNSDWVATYSCVGGTGTMTACSYKGTTCDGGASCSDFKLYGCESNYDHYLPYYSCKESFDSFIDVGGGGLGSGTITCSC